MYMYSLNNFGKMIADKNRMEAYTQALERVVTPDSIVIDIGTGTGIFAQIACRLGARHVYAIEPNDLIRVAEEIAQANGLAAKITFIKDISQNVQIPEAADIIISDLRGVLPVYGHHFDAIIDARSRLLKPEGVLISGRDTLWMAVLEAAEIHKDYVSPWENNPFGIDMSIARNMVVNSIIVGGLKIGSDQLLTLPTNWAALDYRTIQTPNVQGSAQQKVMRAGIAHGILVWFDTELLEGITFSNAPGSENQAEVYGKAIFPLQAPVPVSAGDMIEIKFRATLVDDDYIWNWDTRVMSQDGKVKVQFAQSTFYGYRFSLADLKKNDLAYIPVVNEDGIIASYIIDAMDGAKPIENIARGLIKKFPNKFKDLRDAAESVSRLAKKYSQ